MNHHGWILLLAQLIPYHDTWKQSSYSHIVNCRKDAKSKAKATTRFTHENSLWCDVIHLPTMYMEGKALTKQKIAVLLSITFYSGNILQFEKSGEELKTSAKISACICNFRHTLVRRKVHSDPNTKTWNKTIPMINAANCSVTSIHEKVSHTHTTAIFSATGLYSCHLQ